MKSIFLTFFILTSFFLCASNSQSPPPPTINEFEILTPSVEMLEKFEARIDLTAEYDNPFDYDQISIKAFFTSPTGGVDTVDGFYMRNYTLNVPAGNLFVDGTTEFRVRYAPREVGQYQFQVTATDSTGTTLSEILAFESKAIEDDLNHGFVRTNSSNYLQFDDETSYIPVGENIAWPDNNTYQDFTKWLSKLSENGANFFRLWHAHWGLGIEWSNGNGFSGLREYKQPNCFYQDWLYDYCADRGIYVMLALQHHGPVSTNVNPNWNQSPYNFANGGPCFTTIDFFVNEEAKAHTKNRYRYIVARWGYSKNILCWELFNEVHWTDNFSVNKDLVADWHIEMAEFLDSIDVNNHIITTSYGDDLTDEEVWNNELFGLTQSHIYRNSSNIENILANTSRNFLSTYNKPTLNGEFGLGINSSLANTDPDGIHLHNAIWGSLFGGSAGTAMTWWWESYIHPRDLYFHFLGIDQLVDQVNFFEQNLKPVNAIVSNAPDDLSLQTSLNWANIATDSITINADGTLTPSDTQLSQFLYGSSWNTQYKSAPVFKVNYPQEGLFEVSTGSQNGLNPTMEIWIDSTLVLQDTLAKTDTTYSVTVSEGEHFIHVDNKGTDWITINDYRFENLGSSVSAYVLVGEQKNYASGWVLNQNYNHNYIANNGLPDDAPPVTIAVDSFENGVYSMHLFHPLDGSIISTGTPAIAQDGELKISIPPFLWDVAFIIDDSPVVIQNKAAELGLKVFPNPVVAGQEISIQIEGDTAFDFILLDSVGREVLEVRNTKEKSFPIPVSLAPGFYWVKLKVGDKFGAKPLMITKE